MRPWDPPEAGEPVKAHEPVEPSEPFEIRAHFEASGPVNVGEPADPSAPTPPQHDRVFTWLPRNPRLAQLARQIEQRHGRWRTPAGRCFTGLPPLDEALGGGLLTGAIHELVAATDATATRSLALHAAARAAGPHRWVVYFDLHDDFYPLGAAQLGVALDRLLVLRPVHQTDALWAAELVLRCPAVAATLLPLRRLDPYVSRRLQLAAETGGGLGLLLRRETETGGTFAASRLHCEAVASAGGTRRLRITVVKLRAGCPGTSRIVEVPDAPHPVPAHATPGRRASPPSRQASG